MCCRSEWQERMYIYKWHEVDQTKHEVFCVHIVCNEIQVKVNLEITTFFFYLRFPYCPNFFWFGVVDGGRSVTICLQHVRLKRLKRLVLHVTTVTQLDDLGENELIFLIIYSTYSFKHSDSLTKHMALHELSYSMIQLIHSKILIDSGTKHHNCVQGW